MEKRFFDAVATLTGTTIGAGVLGIPYVVAQAGMLIGAVNIIIIGAAIIILNLYLGEVVLRTKSKHQLTGYAQKYLGRNGKRLMTATMVFAIYGALTAYIIGAGQSLASIFPALNAETFSVIFFAIAAAIVYFGLKAVEESEFLLSGIVIGILALIAAISFFSNHFTTANMTFTDLSKFALPYGVVLFAFLGAVAIPEMSEELSKRKKLLRNAIIAGGAIPLAGYILFTIAVVGVTGADTSQIATIKLGEVFGQRMTVFANLFAVFAMGTSFLALGLALKEMYNYDYKLNKKISWLLTCSIPMAAFLLGIHQFIPVIATAGAIAGGAEGVMIVLMHAKAKKLGERKPEYSIKSSRIIAILLITMFAAGVAYQTIGRMIS